MRRVLAATISSAVLTVLFLVLIVWSIHAGLAARPMRIIPDWWVLPGYAILRTVPSKLGGLVVFVAAGFAFFLLPWIIHADVRNRLQRPAALLALAAFVLSIFALGVAGAHPPDAPVVPGPPGPPVIDYTLNSYAWFARAAIAYYFAYIAFIAPALGWRRKSDIAAAFA